MTGRAQLTPSSNPYPAPHAPPSYLAPRTPLPQRMSADLPENVDSTGKPLPPTWHVACDM